MVAVSTIATLDLLAGGAASLGLLYLLYSETLVVHYRRFFRIITFGLLVYAVTGPVVGRYAPAYIHAVHALAALFVTLGLVDLLREDARSNAADFEILLGSDAPEPGPDADDREEFP